MLARTPDTVIASPTPLGRRPRATIDFETRSEKDVTKIGAWLYSRHHSTQILCLAYVLPGMDPRKPKLWHRAHPATGIKESAPPQDLFDYIATGGLIEAHNAEFEIDIWENIGVPDHGWPSIAPDQWCCSAAKAAAHSLPRSLDGACQALNLPIQKDPRGKTLLRRHSQPQKPTKKERELFGDEFTWNEDPQGLAELWEYCRQDVRAEHRLSESLADLSPMEREVWRITRNMNRRGVLIDTELAEAALDLVRQATAKANGELFELTGITAGTQRKAIKEWLADHEMIDLPDTKAPTVQWFLEREDMTERARRVLTIMKEVNRTSTKKFATMLNCVDEDDRARELLLYCGAERTGRFAGRGIQIHNLPKGRFTLPLSKEDKKRGLAMDLACADVKTRNLAWCEMMHGDVMNLVVSCLRGALIAPPGREFMTADYAAIEARCVLWESGADKALDVFRRGEDIYCDMASGIYGREITKETAKPINSMGATERDFGKVAVLGLGYGMGYLKFLITLRTYNIILTRAEVLAMIGAKTLKKYEASVRKRLFPKAEDFDDAAKYKRAAREASLNRRRLTDEREDPAAVMHELALCKFTVDTYRARYAEVPGMWKAQEAAAIKAVQTGKLIRCGVVTWYVKGRFLRCRLPSGRELKYLDPEIKFAKTSWGETRPGLRFMGINQKTKKLTRQATYGGKLTENITQAIARDVLAFAKLKLEKHPVYMLLLSVHDEIISEVDEGCGDQDEFEAIMSEMPPCMDGCPITAEAVRYRRYRK